ncbi:glycosyltransferase family 9 protein [Magnetospirillum sp. UT-4]|uniref:glycosyltransferase family 9 protein n=1 Tax=Magnetospirillum sp. UT-4 TaxID=2681467 RepID=UPI0013824058|nr:glycosyltransferase family 9 protein [Magnetospirillum sp. UT-4]CAA7622003.1 ADP-heptose:LPS heptosyltransferase [Magnetospirillum sp. UT-4]
MRLHRLLDPVLDPLIGLTGRPGRPSGVLLVSAGGLGDTVLFAVVLPRFLALAEPGETVTVLLRNDAARMAFTFPPGVRVLKLDFGHLRQIGYRRRVFAELYRANFRLVVHTDYLRHPDLDEPLVAACRAPATAAMEPRPSGKHGARLAANRRLYSRLVDSGPPLTDKVVRWTRFANALTARDEPPPVVALPDPPAPAALPAPTLLLQPFSAVALKHSPVALWRRLIEAAPAGWQVRMAGHPSDLERNPEYRALLELPGVAFEGAPFAELAAIIRACRLVVSVDTACMHLAAALGTPTLCLASAAYVGEIVPYAPEVTPANLRVLHRPMECQGCLGACRFAPVDGMYPCVAALDADEAVAAMRGMIA